MILHFVYYEYMIWKICYRYGTLQIIWVITKTSLISFITYSQEPIRYLIRVLSKDKECFLLKTEGLVLAILLFTVRKNLVVSFYVNRNLNK